MNGHLTPDQSSGKGNKHHYFSMTNTYSITFRFGHSPTIKTEGSNFLFFIRIIYVAWEDPSNVTILHNDYKLISDGHLQKLTALF